LSATSIDIRLLVELSHKSQKVHEHMVRVFRQIKQTINIFD